LQAGFHACEFSAARAVYQYEANWLKPFESGSPRQRPGEIGTATRAPERENRRRTLKWTADIGSPP